MNTFLSTFSKLDSVQEVTLLSNQGEPLFSTQKNSTTENREKIYSYWNTIISELSLPHTAEFAFSNGSYFLVRINIGYLILGINDNKALPKIKQACSTIHTKLSNPTLCKRVLFNLLAQSDNIIKQNIIKELVSYADEEVAAMLTFLLRKEEEFTPDTKNDLLLLICQTLGYCSSSVALDALNEFQLKHTTTKPSPQLTEAIRLSKEQLEHFAAGKETLPPESQHSEAQNKVVKSPPKKNNPTTQINVPQQQQIESLLHQDKKSEAVALIMHLVDSCAAKKQFDAADRLREWLITIDPMALMNIIHAADVIDKAKQAAINPEHLEVWKALIEMLSSEEFSSLYHSMTLRSYAKGKPIVQQGSHARTLLLINKGYVQTQALTQEITIPLAVKGAGEVIGAVTFFEASVWTMSAKSLGCELFLLSRTKFDALKEQFPSLEAKLLDFCLSLRSAETSQKKAGSNRRQFQRKKVSGKIGFVVLDTNGNTIGNEAQGNLIDISTGGVAFSIHSSQKKNAAGLFGRQLRLSINTGVATQVLIRKGTVQAVRDINLIGNEYSLHLEFRKQLSSTELQQIVHN